MVHPSIIQFSTIRNEVYAELQNHDKVFFTLIIFINSLNIM